MKLLILILILSAAAFGDSSGLSMTGADDFKVLARSGKIVDKTLLIRDLIDQNDLATLITRPRRWGKSTSMNMVWRFFNLEQDKTLAKENRQLFENLKIQNATVRDPTTGKQVNASDQFQGKCPSIFLSFKDVRGNTVDELVVKLKEAISEEFRRHNYLAEDLESKTENQEDSTYARDLAGSNLNKFKRLALNDGRTATNEDLENSLKFLSQLLYDYHNKTQVCVFLDEYDAPLHKAFTQGYLMEGTDIIRNLFGAVLKGNPTLQRALLTGILRLAGANLFSGLNNLVEDNVLNSKYKSHYGFTSEDVDELFRLFNTQPDDKELFRETYNGYGFYSTGNESSRVDIYNPWSVVNYLKNNNRLDNYWIGTGGTELLQHLVIRPELQDGLETLRNSRSLELPIPKDVTFSGITDRGDTLWPLLVHSGYLTLEQAPISHVDSNMYRVKLKIPNKEVRSAYNDFHDAWLKSNGLPRLDGIGRFNELVKATIARKADKVLEWIDSEVRSGSPLSFSGGQWKLNPLQLAALSGDTNIFNSVLKQYPKLIHSEDSDGMNIGDYALLARLHAQNIPECSALQEDSIGVRECLCWWNESPVLIIDICVLGGTATLFGKTAERIIGVKPNRLFQGGYFVVGILVQAFKVFGQSLVKNVMGTTCERFKRYSNIPPKNYSTLRHFGEYILRNAGSYVSLGQCKENDILISQFNKSVTDVKHAEIQPLTFSLCKPGAKAEL